VILLLAACGGSEPPPIPDPDQLAPLEAVNLAPELPTSGGVPPESITFAAGQDEDGIYWAHAKGYVAQDLGTVWTCFQDPLVVMDRREVDAWTAEFDVEPAFDVSFVIHQTVYDLITIEFDLLWLHEQQAGPVDAPEQVAMRWQKTEGTNFIDLLEGSALLTVAAPGVTRIELIEHLDAALRDEETIRSYLSDLYESVRACAHGDPLPSW
jgi:hypothetical protein